MHNVDSSENLAKKVYEKVIRDKVNNDTAVLVVNLLPFLFGPSVQTYDFDSTEIFEVRRIQSHIRETLHAHHCREEMIANAEIACIELIGNAVRYAPGDVRVVVDTSSPAMVIHVLDRGRGFDYAPNDFISVNRESGRGLFIIRQLVEALYIGRRNGGGSHARIVLAV